MARVSTFVYCENVQNENTPLGTRNNIIGPMASLRPIFVPGTFSFSIFISVLDIELEKSHEFRIIFTDGVKSIIDTGNAGLPGQNVEDDLPKSERGFMLNMDFRNVVFEKEGEHISKVYFDGELIGEYPIYVKKAKDARFKD